MAKNIDHVNVIHYGTDSVIVRLEANGNGKTYCEKTLTDEFPSTELTLQLANEFEICSATHASSIRKAIKKERSEDKHSIQLELIDGVDLGEYLENERPGFLKQLEIAANIAKALYELQQENIFHRQIIPSNILIEKQTDKIFLIDFGRATIGNVFESGSYFHDRQKEHLQYIAPEQTGRVNRTIDSRSDLYSFGVILYQLFTGELPFESEDPLELIYAHVAKTPVSPDQVNKHIPGVVAAIVMKLLAKNAEERYQSAFGVKQDLEICLRDYKANEKVDFFKIAAKDFSGKLFIPSKLFGRTTETRTLHQKFDAVLAGGNITLFLSGYSGSGKSALAETLQKPVMIRKGFFVKGKFDQIGSNTPYSTFAQAFSELVLQLQTGDETVQARWKKRISTSLGNSVRVLTEFIPALENLVGKLPEVQQLKGIEAQNRFNYEFVRFIKTIADKEHPLVIFVDDLQWADASSLNLFKLIAENRDIEYVMLIGAYRSNEVNDDHPLIRKLFELRDEQVNYEEMELGDLKYDDVNHLIENALLTKQENISFLSDMVYEKTKGNAFYVWQFLRSIYDERFLWFDFDLQRWQWNADLIMQMNVSGNVVELMTDYIQKLPGDTLDLLCTAATIGNKFEKRVLSIIKNINENRLDGLLKIAISEGLIIPAGKEYKFAHDRIQQAVYSIIPAKEKMKLHLENARKLEYGFTQHESQERIFEIVNQWNLGADLLNDKNEKVNLSKLNAVAGNKAIASTAYPQALQYFERSIALLDKNDWDTHYDLLLNTTKQAAETAYLSGFYENVEKHTSSIFTNSKSLIDSVGGYETEIKKLVAQAKLNEAINLGLVVLKKMGIRFPEKPNQFSILLGLFKTKWRLRKKSIDYYGNLPLMQDEQKKAAMRIMYEISAASYFVAPNLVPLIVFRMIDHSVRYGLSQKSPFCFSAYGFILSVHLREIENGSRFGDIALRLAKKINAEEVTGSILATSNLFLDHWKKPLPELKEDLEKAFKTSIDFGDNEWATYAAHNMIYQLYLTGTNLEELSKKAESLELEVEKFKQSITLMRIQLFRQAIHNLINITDNPDIFNGAFFNESAFDIDDVTKSTEVYFQNLYFLKLHLAIIFNESKNAVKYLEYIERFQETVKGTALAPQLYFYRSLVIADMSVNTKKDPKILKRVRKDIRMLKNFEKISPKYNSHKTLLLEAEYYYLKGELGLAKIYYDKALTAATENGLINDFALGWERAGQFFINTKQDLLANFYLQNAYRAYKRWGAFAKTKQMEKRYPQLNSVGGITGGLAEFGGDTSTEKPSSLDLATVLKASSAIAGEIKLPRLLKKMMQIIMENAGAQTGFLIMEKKGERFIEAEINPGNKNIKVLHAVPVHRSGLLAESVVNYVYQSQEAVVLDDAGRSNLFSNDAFIANHDVRSLLCFPLINMGKTQAVIYLANDLTYGVFNEKRVELLKLLAAQMAVSIENALFYSELENKVEERTNELYLEKKKSDDLLLNILPETVAEELKQTGKTTPRSYEIATVMFTDFENFTLKSEKLSPEELVSLIDTCFKRFDEIISKHNIEKIKTIGDAYLCVSGLPDNKDHNAENVVKAALEILDVIRELQQTNKENSSFDIRIGIHTGPLVAGVVGDKKFAYDIWGDTVNTAARMEQNSEANRINISQSTYELVKSKYNCIFRGKQPAKNKGLIEMYFVEGPL